MSFYRQYTTVGLSILPGTHNIYIYYNILRMYFSSIFWKYVNICSIYVWLVFFFCFVSIAFFFTLHFTSFMPTNKFQFNKYYDVMAKTDTQTHYR